MPVPAPAAVRALLALACLLLASASAAPTPAALAAAAKANETASLLELKAAVSGSSNALDGWVEGTDPCNPPWVGINCTVAGRVASIILPGLSLSGSLPANLTMTVLQEMDLSNNKLTGPLPPTLKLPSLQKLSLADNQLSGTLPPSWAANFPQLLQLELQGNRLAGTMPPLWLQPTGFATPFTAVVQPGNLLLCGAVATNAGHTLLYSDSGLQHDVITTLGSCAQDANCGVAAINRSATNLYDVAWANGVAPMDLENINFNVQPDGSAPKVGTPITLPCYPSNAPTYFGSDAAYRKATWQSSTEGTRSSFLPVSGNKLPATPEDCSMTINAPAFWMVDLQVSVQILAVLVRAGDQQMLAVDIRVSDTPNPNSGSLCQASEEFNPNQGKIIVCQRPLKGRYLSISAATKVTLCTVEVYPLVTNAALGKPTSGSADISSNTQASSQVVVNGKLDNTACATVVSGPNLAAWITIDFGYEATVETVVVQNGIGSTFKDDLFITLGNTPVVNGDENPFCSSGQTLEGRVILPIQCIGKGRFLTLYRKLTQSSTMYICQVMAFLSAGPTSFFQAPPSPPMPPASPPPSPMPPPSPIVGPTIDVSPTTAAMAVTLVLEGPSVLPLTPESENNIVLAVQNVWVGQEGMTAVSPIEFEVIESLPPSPMPGGTGLPPQLDGSGLSPVFAELASMDVNPAAAASLPSAATGRRLAQALETNTTVLGRLSVQLQVDVQMGMAPGAANYIVITTANGTLAAAFNDQGTFPETQPAVVSILTLVIPVSPPPPPTPPSPDNNSGDAGGGSAPIGAIVGGVAGGVVVFVLAAGLLYYRRRRQQRRLLSDGEPDDNMDSPKVTSMEQGRSAPTMLGLPPKPGDHANGYLVAAAAAGNNGKQAAPLELDTSSLTVGPPAEIMSFLSDDVGSDHSAFARESPSTAGMSQGGDEGGTLGKHKSAARMDSGVSELWTVDFGELDIQKQIGEGSFGKVYLAKWRETTVAVKVLGNMGAATSPGLDDEFPDASTAMGHPLYESLQKEAAMMASLRHPSIVMYLGVCVDPPAVVTEYCARGSLNDVLKRARNSPLLAAQLDWARRLNMALDAAKGMLYLHSCSPPIIHRDLKSANLLVDKHWRVRVCDFNLSRVMEDTAVLSSVAATNPRWLAPEILSGKGYTFASDVYSFGICMWELLTWQVPYHEYGPWQVVAMVTESAKRPEVPASEDLPSPWFSGEGEYLALMCECWAQEPAARPTFTAIISRLRRMLAQEATQRRTDSPTKAAMRAHSGMLGSGNETPGARSRLASLTTASELCISPEPRSSTCGGDEISDAEALSAGGSPLVLGPAPGMRPCRSSTGGAGPSGISSGGSAPRQQLAPIASSGDAEAPAAEAAAEAAVPAAEVVETAVAAAAVETIHADSRDPAPG